MPKFYQRVGDTYQGLTRDQALTILRDEANTIHIVPNPAELPRDLDDRFSIGPHEVATEHLRHIVCNHIGAVCRGFEDPEDAVRFVEGLLPMSPLLDGVTFRMLDVVDVDDALTRLRAGGNVLIRMRGRESTAEVRSNWLTREPPFMFEYVVILDGDEEMRLTTRTPETAVRWAISLVRGE